MIEVADKPPLFTSFPPTDERRFIYSYLGKRLWGRKWANFQPIYVNDARRSRPYIALGASQSGISEFLISTAFQDASKGRACVYIDTEASVERLNKLYYYNHIVAGQPFYAFFIDKEWDHLSNTFNPLLNPSISVNSMAELFVQSMNQPLDPRRRADEKEIKFLNQLVLTLIRSLQASGFISSPADFLKILTRPEIMEGLPNHLNEEGRKIYSELLHRYQEGGMSFRDRLKTFADYLKNLSAWNLNSYNPDIQLDKAIEFGATIYIGLSYEKNRAASVSLGNLILNQLKSLCFTWENRDRQKRRAVSCLVDRAEYYLDDKLKSWINNVRFSSLMLVAGIQLPIARMMLGEAFFDDLKKNRPNFLMFHPGDKVNAQLLSDLSVNSDAAIHKKEEGVKSNFTPIKPDIFTELETGQFFFMPFDFGGSPIKIGGCYLPHSPQSDMKRYYRVQHGEKGKNKGVGSIIGD
jgi:hypothetical protein